MRIRAVFFDSTRSNLPLAIEYHLNNNRLTEATDLTGNDKRKAEPPPVTLLARTIKVGEMVLMRGLKHSNNLQFL